MIGGCALYSYVLDRPYKIVRTSSGQAGAFTIGESKDEIILRARNESFSPRPKPMACPKNWIEVSKMSEAEKECLLSADAWEVGLSPVRAACPQGASVSTKLHFTNGKLSEVITECWPAK
jgi:hypothetical protein